MVHEGEDEQNNVEQLQNLLVPVDVIRHQLQVLGALALVDHGLLELVDLALGTGAAHSPGDVDDKEDDVEGGNVDGVGSAVGEVVGLGGEHANVLISVACCRLDEFEDEKHECGEDADTFETKLYLHGV